VGDLDDILRAREEPVVQNDNTVRYVGLMLQIPEQRHQRHFIKQRVRLRFYFGGSLTIFHGRQTRPLPSRSSASGGQKFRQIRRV
jgi:hypothetical protein